MLCSHSVREGPLSRYPDLGSAVRETRSHVEPTFRLSRNRHEESREMPTTSPNTALSRCHPMPAPAAYSVTRTCWSRSGATPVKLPATSQGTDERRNVVGLSK